MATKLSVPRPALKGKVQPKEKEKAKETVKEVVLEATELADEVDNTEPSAAPPIEAIEEEALILEATPILPGILIGPTPPPIEIASPPPPSTPRVVAMSLPSQYELDSERKSSPPVAMRRKELAKYVASAVGVAWFICTCAIGETALRSIIASMH